MANMEKMVQITERTIILKQSDHNQPEHETKVSSLMSDTMTSMDIKVLLGLGLASVLLSTMLIMELWPNY